MGLLTAYLGDGDLVSKVKEHNRTCEARFSYATHYGYLCPVQGCGIMMANPEDLPQIYTIHQDVLPKDMAARDQETQQVVAIVDIFTWVMELPDDSEESILVCICNSLVRFFLQI